MTGPLAGARGAAEEGFVEVGGVRLHWLRSGGDKPPLLLAHGFSDSAACWASSFRLLAPDWDVVAFDARGHGRSAAPASGYSGQEQADDLLGLVDALGLERPVLMGHSMGGETAAWAALRRPGLARALVLEDACIPPADAAELSPEARAKLRAGLAAWIEGLKRRSLAELVAQVAEQDPSWPEEDRLPWAASKHAVSRRAVEGFTFNLRPHVSERFAEIACPVLLLKADAPPAERERQREIAARLPAGEIAHVAGAGHNVRRDRPRRAAELLLRFLARV